MAFAHRPGSGEQGATLLELVSMIVIIGVLSYFAFVNLAGSNVDVKEQALAKKIISDVRFAQEMAMSHGQMVQFIVEPGENRYSLKWQDDSFLKTPVAPADFIVDTDDGYYGGTDLSATGFSAGTLQFDGDGTPLEYGSPLVAEKTLVQLNGATSIFVMPGTGRCMIQ